MFLKRRIYIFVLILTAATIRLNAQAVGGDFDAKKDSLDQIEKSFIAQKDSLQGALQSRVSSIDSLSASYQHKIDSLNKLQLPSGEYTGKLDSIKHLRADVINGFNGKLQTLKYRSIEKVKGLNLPPELTDKAEQSMQNLKSADLSLSKIDVPELDLSKASFPLETDKIQAIADVPKIELPNDLGKMQNLPNIKGNVDAYQQNIEGLTQKDGKGLQKLSNTAESKLTGTKEISELQKQTGALEQKSNLENSQALREKIMLQAKQKAGDHFKGKEMQLNEAIAKTDKYKQKYSDIPSIKDIKNKKPNEMRGKPWFERLVPGVAFQTFRKHSLMADINPYVGYRLTGNLTAGIGWDQRIIFNTHAHKFTSSERVYGVRTFLEYKAFKGFSFRLEPEYVNAYVPYAISASHTDQRKREWIFGAFAGIKKGYKFFGNMKGTIFVFYNLYDPHNKSPYSERLNVRFGFEYPIKRSKKKS